MTSYLTDNFSTTAPTDKTEPYNDLKLSDSGVRRGTCMVAGKAAVEAGKVFLERSYLVLAQLEQAIEVTQRIGRGEVGRV